MNVGTRSILFGYHSFWLHGFFVARGWYLLHGWSSVKIGVKVHILDPENDVWVREDVYTSLFDPRLWLAFFVHDLGYWGSPNMNGDEGELHPFLGYRIMDHLFGAPWGTFCLYHSRFLAKRDGEDPSMLCAPDKMAIACYPLWLFLLLNRLSGEIREYMAHHKNVPVWMEQRQKERHWAREVFKFSKEYAEGMKHGGTDTLTGSANDTNIQDQIRPRRTTELFQETPPSNTAIAHAAKRGSKAAEDLLNHHG